MRGRKPLPAGLKLLKGNPGGRPPVGRPGVPGAAPRCPRHLTPAARKEWDRLAPDLARMGLLTRVDVAALAAYCQTYARWCECEAIITRDGLTLSDASGKITLHPAARHAEQLSKQIRALAVEFGFTPSSRGRIELPSPSAECDDFDNFLADGSTGGV